MSGAGHACVAVCAQMFPEYNNGYSNIDNKSTDSLIDAPKMLRSGCDAMLFLLGVGWPADDDDVVGAELEVSEPSGVLLSSSASFLIARFCSLRWLLE